MILKHRPVGFFFTMQDTEAKINNDFVYNWKTSKHIFVPHHSWNSKVVPPQSPATQETALLVCLSSHCLISYSFILSTIK